MVKSVAGVVVVIGCARGSVAPYVCWFFTDLPYLTDNILSL